MSAYSELYPVVPNGNITITWEPLVDEDNLETFGDEIQIGNARVVGQTNTYTEIDVSVLSDTIKHFALGLKDDSFNIEIIGGLRGLEEGDKGQLTITYAEGDISASGIFALSQATKTFTSDAVNTVSCRFIRYRGKQ